MSPFRFALREIRYRPVFAGLFLLSVAVGTASLAALAGVSGVVRQTITDQARELWAADITVRGSPTLLEDLNAWANVRWPGTVSARTIDTLSMARHLASDRTGQVTLSALTPRYPLYGEIVTASGRPLENVLTPGHIVVGDNLLAGWGLAVGDRLRLGQQDLEIADTIARRTDVPTSFFELSPTVLITFSDLDRTELLAPGSRAMNVLYLNLPPGTDLRAALAEIKEQAAKETTEVASWVTDNPGLLKFIQNTLLYLDFLALLTLTLGGVGAATALSAARAAATRSLAMVFALGAPRRFVYRVWTWWIALMAGAGILAALALGRTLAGLLLALFGDLLPAGLVPVFPAAALLQASLVGLTASFLFTLFPLLKLGDIPPNAILSDDVPVIPPRPARSFLLGLVGVLVFTGLAWVQLRKPWLAVQYVGVLLTLLLTGAGLVALSMAVVRRWLGTRQATTARLAARGLARPGHLNDAVVLSIGLSLGVILTLFLLEKNLTTQIIESFPPDTPNAFFINLQPAQAPVFLSVTGRPDARLFPLIRGRVTAINDRSVRDLNLMAQNRRGQGDRLTREFGFTFGENILATDRVVEGPGLWDPSLSGPQVSVFDEYKKRFGLRRGDRVTVSVLGRRFTATLSSFRSINRSVRQPFFYFHFKPGLLDEVPHTLMTGLSVPRQDLPDLQNRLAERLPNVTIIDLSDVADLTGRIFRRLARVVTALGLFGLSSGLLLLLSSLLASLASRLRDTALFRVLGAARAQVVRVALLEYTLIAGAGALAALVLGGTSTALLLNRVFDLQVSFFPLPTAGLLTLSVAAAVLLSWFVTRGVFRAAPLDVLRHE